MFRPPVKSLDIQCLARAMALSSRGITLLLCSAVLSDSFRVKHRSGSQSQESMSDQSGSGYVKSLYTWGAAAINKGGNLPDPRKGDGCWQGLRVVNIATPNFGWWDSDIVSGVANVVGYWHAKQPTARVSNTSEVHDYSCGVEGPRPVFGKVSLHGTDVYEARANLLSGDARTLTKYFVSSSYMIARDAADYIGNSGYKLVGSSEWDAKETHLFQHPSSKNCVLAFQGTTSERLLDWWDNIRFYDVDFCGLRDSVHGGFRDQLRAIVDSQSFKSNIQNKLPMCNDLTVVGHSLGGALAALYSYCLNAGSSGGEDNNRVKFTRSTPSVIPSLF